MEMISYFNYIFDISKKKYCFLQSVMYDSNVYSLIGVCVQGGMSKNYNFE